MPLYRRIVSYLYRYEQMKKQECCGFVKAEQRNHVLKMIIQVEDPHFPDLYFRGEEETEKEAGNRAQTSMQGLRVVLYRNKESEDRVTGEPAHRSGKGQYWPDFYSEPIPPEAIYQEDNVRTISLEKILPDGFDLQGGEGLALLYYGTLQYGTVWQGDELPVTWLAQTVKEGAGTGKGTEIEPVAAGSLDDNRDGDDTQKVRTDTGSAKDAAPADEGAPAKDVAPVDEVDSADDGAPAKDAAPADKGDSADDTAPADEGAPAKDAAPADEGAPAKDAAPADKVDSADDAAPADEGASAKNAASDDDVAPVDEVDPKKIQRDNETGRSGSSDKVVSADQRGEDRQRNDSLKAGGIPGVEDKGLSITETPEPSSPPDLLEALRDQAPKADQIFNGAFCEGYRILPDMLVHMGTEALDLSDNQFLLKGYEKYQHLLAARVVYDGEERYCIGIPGVYENREKYMARLYQFPVFLSLTEYRIKTGRPGYWLHILA